jgi:hypothetical protein
MRKFDGKDPVNWILQMEQYFDLHDVQLLQKVYCIFIFRTESIFMV